MKILRTSNDNMDAVTVYRLSKSPAVRKLSDAAGETIWIAEYVFYEDVNADGEPQTICSIRTVDGDVFATNSRTFVREFSDMIDMFEDMGEKVDAVKIVQGTSKGGRTFITCDVAE